MNYSPSVTGTLNDLASSRTGRVTQKWDRWKRD